MPSTTSLTSAPTASHTAAIALTKRDLGGEEGVGRVLDRLGRRRVGDDERRGDARGRATATRMAAAWSSLPITMRSGCRKSWTAEPSRRNSGFDTTSTSGRPSARSTTRVEPTGTVDLLTTTAPGGRSGRDLAGRGLDVARGRPTPSSPCGVGTHRKTNSAVGDRGRGAERRSAGGRWRRPSATSSLEARPRGSGSRRG